MRLFLSLFFCLSTACAAPTPHVSSPCIAATATRADEPPAWLLLSAAVVLLGAGRLARS